MRWYVWNKHILEPSPESFPYSEHLEHYSEVAEDKRSEKSQFSLAVKIKRQSSQSAQLSASFLTISFCVYSNFHQYYCLNESFTTFSGLIIQLSSIIGKKYQLKFFRIGLH